MVMRTPDLVRMVQKGPVSTLVVKSVESVVTLEGVAGNAFRKSWYCPHVSPASAIFAYTPAAMSRLPGLVTPCGVSASVFCALVLKLGSSVSWSCQPLSAKLDDWLKR